MEIPYELVSMAMILRDYVTYLPYINNEHERLVEFSDFLLNSDADEQEIADLIDAGYDPSDLLKKYDESYFVQVISAYMAMEEYLENDGDAQEMLVDYLKVVGYKPYNPKEGLDDIILFNTKIKASKEFEVGTGDTFTFTFNSPEEIYEMIDGGIDLYCIDEEVYMFKYNEPGSIAYYYLSEDELYRLAQDAYDHDAGYIGGELGVGGYIIDVQVETPDGNVVDYDDPDFDEYYNRSDCDLDITEICNFLQRFVGKKFINANVDDLVKEE